MTGVRTSALRLWLAAALSLVLLVAGVGRGWATSSVAVDMPPAIPGVAVVHICHADQDGGAGTGEPGRHDCCDVCALCAPAALPGQPDLTGPARVVHFVAHGAALRWAPALLRPRTPRLAQGPPAA